MPEVPLVEALFVHGPFSSQSGSRVDDVMSQNQTGYACSKATHNGAWLSRKNCLEESPKVAAMRKKT